MSLPWFSKTPTDCRWSRDRLALLAGDDLLTAERRRVERHLIGCPSCRGLARSTSDALALLRSASRDDGAPGAPPPSLWPEVRRQIHRSRHEPRPFPPARFALIGGLAASLGFVLFAAFGRPSRPSIASEPVPVVVKRPPLPIDADPAMIAAKPAPRPASSSSAVETGASGLDPQRSY